MDSHRQRLPTGLPIRINRDTNRRRENLLRDRLDRVASARRQTRNHSDLSCRLGLLFQSNNRHPGLLRLPTDSVLVPPQTTPTFSRRATCRIPTQAARPPRNPDPQILRHKIRFCRRTPYSAATREIGPPAIPGNRVHLRGFKVRNRRQRYKASRRPQPATTRS